MDLFASGRVVDVILALMAVEWLALVALRRTAGAAPRRLACNFLAGAALLLALRSALVGAAWPWVAACLALALCAHVGDLVQRLRPA